MYSYVLMFCLGGATAVYCFHMCCVRRVRLTATLVSRACMGLVSLAPVWSLGRMWSMHYMSRIRGSESGPCNVHCWHRVGVRLLLVFDQGVCPSGLYSS